MTFFEHWYLVWTSIPGWKENMSEMALERSHQSADQSPSSSRLLFDAFADLRGLGWESVSGLLEAAPIPVPEECQALVVRDPQALITSITRNPTVAEWVTPSSEGITFEQFTHEIFEPYILGEVHRRFSEAQAQLECFVTEKHSHFEERMVGMATEWVKKVQQSYQRQLMSATALKDRLKALEQAAEQGVKIDGENDVLMDEAPPLPLVRTGLQSYAPFFAEAMADDSWRDYLTTQARETLGYGSAGIYRNPLRISPFTLAGDQ